MKPKKKFWPLFLEALILFMGIPMLFYWDLIPLPKILVLILAAAYCGFQLWRDPDFGFGMLVKTKPKSISKSFLIRFPLVAITLVAITAVAQPDQFLAFPSNRPFVWMVVMLLYPLLSALPQEFIFRSFFFHRYAHLIKVKYGTILASAAAFSFLHIIYDNWWAVALSFIGGLLFGLTYKRTKSLYWVTVEHAIYGCLVFTLGMGNYFYEAF
ncbi:CAAX protease self-immunity [Fodinibius salinus]|uniref:CAAX protease self-immunity n=1 Tax=Fodinibius salinus TaxID=860790 RepID=A0A5D3YM76_9BACT|nr:type II CAAX endopeptidase family protein [Fodinibius salinus]TYP93781.1 CAAX protease self-immunity [Fodinibius salinus]